MASLAGITSFAGGIQEGQLARRTDTQQQQDRARQMSEDDKARYISHMNYAVGVIKTLTAAGHPASAAMPMLNKIFPGEPWLDELYAKMPGSDAQPAAPTDASALSVPPGPGAAPVNALAQAGIPARPGSIQGALNPPQPIVPAIPPRNATVPQAAQPSGASLVPPVPATATPNAAPAVAPSSGLAPPVAAVSAPTEPQMNTLADYLGGAQISTDPKFVHAAMMAGAGPPPTNPALMPAWYQDAMQGLRADAEQKQKDAIDLANARKAAPKTFNDFFASYIKGKYQFEDYSSDSQKTMVDAFAVIAEPTSTPEQRWSALQRITFEPSDAVKQKVAKDAATVDYLKAGVTARESIAKLNDFMRGFRPKELLSKEKLAELHDKVTLTIAGMRDARQAAGQAISQAGVDIRGRELGINAYKALTGNLGSLGNMINSLSKQALTMNDGPDKTDVNNQIKALTQEYTASTDASKKMKPQVQALGGLTATDGSTPPPSPGKGKKTFTPGSGSTFKGLGGTVSPPYPGGTVKPAAVLPAGWEMVWVPSQNKYMVQRKARGGKSGGSAPAKKPKQKTGVTPKGHHYSVVIGG